MMAYDYPHPVSRTYQYRKITKPLLERKRRARINRCLDELKDLMVDALETEGEDISKLEKADILELTVRHLQRLHASRASGLSSTGSPSEESATSPAENRWQSGFGHCAAEACRYLAALPGESGERLARHLASGLRGRHRRNATAARNKNSSPIVHERCENFRESRTTDSPMETSATASMDSRTSESPIDSPAHSSPISGNADFANKLPISGNADFANKLPISGCALEESSRDSKNSKSGPTLGQDGVAGPLTVAAKGTEVKAVRVDGRYGGGEDEEEIDVEGVDEGDPMWRPW